MTRHYDIVFDSLPEPRSTFVDIEDDSGRSIRLGEWVTREDGAQVLRIPVEEIKRPHEREDTPARWMILTEEVGMATDWMRHNGVRQRDAVIATKPEHIKGHDGPGIGGSMKYKILGRPSVDLIEIALTCGFDWVSRDPVPETKTTLSGRHPDPDLVESSAPQPVDPETGMHKDYWVLSAEERARGFIRPLRMHYTHEKCGTETRMNIKIAETYARKPTFYSHTFCASCKEHLPVDEFLWDDGTIVGH